MKKIKIMATVATLAFASVLSVGVLARAETDKTTPTETTVTKATDMTPGEVRKIDKEAGKLTLKHDRIKNLNMPGMTMVFKVMNMDLLDNLQVGDKIKFKAINDKGRLTITDIKTDK